MLRPIKSLLTYLQKNASEAFNSPNSDNNQTLTEEQQEDDINMETITPENHFHQVDQSDQNENTLKTDFPVDGDDMLTPNATNVSTPNPEDSFYLDEIPTELIVVDANTSSNSLLNQSTESIGDPLAIDEFEADELDDPLNSSGNHFVDITNTSSDGIELDAELPAPTSPSTPLQSILKKRNDKEEQSDGSDSGLGSENSTPSAHNATTVISKPLRSNLKRRAEDVEFVQKEKKPKRSINFDVVQVYYFPRRQGFNCVPSQGGCTLGMDKIHTSFKVFPLNDHFYESRPINIQDGTMAATNTANVSKSTNNSSGEESDSDEDFTEASESDMDLDNSGFLQPIPIKQRRVMLKAAGVRKIDPIEKKECRDIRTSREYCGCNCRGFCDPDTCMCSRFGIKCQVDRPSFPCKCTHDTCQNPHGRVEFNPERVRRHYIHTMMRLSLESTVGNRHNPHNYFLQQTDTEKDHRNGNGPQQYHHQPSSSTSNNFYVPDTPTHSTVSYTHNESQAQLAYNTYYQTPNEIFNTYANYDENAHQHQPTSYSNFNNGKNLEIITRCDQLQDESKDIIGFSADGDVELNLNVPTPQPPPDIEEKEIVVADEEEAEEEEISTDKIYTTLEVPKKVEGDDTDIKDVDKKESTSIIDSAEGSEKDDDNMQTDVIEKGKESSVDENKSEEIPEKDVLESDTISEVEGNDVVDEEKCVDGKDVVDEEKCVDGKDVVEDGKNSVVEVKEVVEDDTSSNVEVKELVEVDTSSNVEEKELVEVDTSSNVEETELLKVDKSLDVEEKELLKVDKSSDVDGKEVVDDLNNGDVEKNVADVIENTKESSDQKEESSAEHSVEKDSTVKEEVNGEESFESCTVVVENEKSEDKVEGISDVKAEELEVTMTSDTENELKDKDATRREEVLPIEETVSNKEESSKTEEPMEVEEDSTTSNVSEEDSKENAEEQRKVEEVQIEIKTIKVQEEVQIRSQGVDKEEENQKEDQSSSEEKQEEVPIENGHFVEESKGRIVTSEEMADPREEETPPEEEFKDAVDNSRENIKDSSIEIDEDFQDAVEHPVKSTEVLHQNGTASEEPTCSSQENQLKENGQPVDAKLIVGQV